MCDVACCYRLVPDTDHRPGAWLWVEGARSQYRGSVSAKCPTPPAVQGHGYGLQVFLNGEGRTASSTVQGWLIVCTSWQRQFSSSSQSRGFWSSISSQLLPATIEVATAFSASCLSKDAEKLSTSLTDGTDPFMTTSFSTNSNGSRNFELQNLDPNASVLRR